jgi:hypothetical protein
MGRNGCEMETETRSGKSLSFSRKGLRMSATRDKLELVAVLTRELDQPVGAVVELAQSLIRLGVKHGGLACALCNGVIDQDEYARRQGKIRDKLTALLGGSGIGVEFGGDPRGYTVKLQLPSKRSNTWGDDGYGIPGS